MFRKLVTVFQVLSLPLSLSFFLSLIHQSAIYASLSLPILNFLCIHMLPWVSSSSSPLFLLSLHRHSLFLCLFSLPLFEPHMRAVTFFSLYSILSFSLPMLSSTFWTTYARYIFLYLFIQSSLFLCLCSLPLSEPHMRGVSFFLSIQCYLFSLNYSILSSFIFHSLYSLSLFLCLRCFPLSNQRTLCSLCARHLSFYLFISIWSVFLSVSSSTHAHWPVFSALSLTSYSISLFVLALMLSRLPSNTWSVTSPCPLTRSPRSPTPFSPGEITEYLLFCKFRIISPNIPSCFLPGESL